LTGLRAIEFAGDQLAVPSQESADEASKAVVLKYVGNLFPNDEGTEVRRSMTSMPGDEMKLANPNPGSGGRSEALYRRMK